MNSTSTLLRAATTTALFASAATAQSVISQIGWHGASPAVITGIAAFFTAAIVVLVTIYANTRRKNAKADQEASLKQFRENCQRCRLNAEEADMLGALAVYARGSAFMAHQIFDKQALFEHCVDAYVSRLAGIYDARAADTDDLINVIRKKIGFGILSPEMPLMSTRNISTGQAVTIFNDGQPAAAMAAKITHVGELFFTARLSEEFRAGHGLKTGDETAITFLRHGDAAYGVNVKIKDADGAESSGDVSFLHTMKFSRKQKRRYMRLDTCLPIKYRVLESPSLGQGEKPSPEMRQARTVDIGGGGVSFSSETAQPMGDVILLTLLMPGKTLGGIKAKILRVMPIINMAGETHYKHMIQFTSIETPQREFIIKFIFEKQREMLQMR